MARKNHKPHDSTSYSDSLSSSNSSNSSSSSISSSNSSNSSGSLAYSKIKRYQTINNHKILSMKELKNIIFMFNKKLDYLDSVPISEISTDYELKALILKMLDGYSPEWRNCPYRNCFDLFTSLQYTKTYDEMDKAIINAFITRVYFCSGKLIRDYESIRNKEI